MSTRTERKRYLAGTILPLLEQAAETLQGKDHEANVDDTYTATLNVIPSGEEDAVGLWFWGAGQKSDAIRWMRTDENHIRVIDDFDPAIAEGIVKEFVKTFA